MKIFYIGFSFLFVTGCFSSDVASGTEDRDRYIAFCRETALTPIAECNPDDVMRAVDWMVYPCTATTQEFRRDFRVTYADERYLSFRCEEYSYTGGAHGVTTITIGTIDRKTGKTLKSDDVFPAKDREALEAYLRVLAIRLLGGEDHLQGEVKITDNFCLMGDGWHFIYNEYEIACYADGAVEIVLPR